MERQIALGVWCNDEEVFTNEDQYNAAEPPVQCANCNSRNIVLVRIVAL